MLHLAIKRLLGKLPVRYTSCQEPFWFPSATRTYQANREDIVEETRVGGSKILLLGIVPVHRYSAAEKDELEQVRKRTAAMLKKVKSALTKEGIEVSEAVKAGYPDEEILKAAEEYSVSLIMLPAGGKTPSELNKAAAILLDEPDRMRMPIKLMQVVEA